MFRALTFAIAASLSVVAHADTLRTYAFLTGGTLTYDVDRNEFVGDTSSSTGLEPGEISFTFQGVGQKTPEYVPTLLFESFNPTAATDPNDPLMGYNEYSFDVPTHQCVLSDLYGNCFAEALTDPGPTSYSLEGFMAFNQRSPNLELTYLSTVSTPEPSSVALFGTGLLGMLTLMKGRVTPRKS